MLTNVFEGCKIFLWPYGWWMWQWVWFMSDEVTHQPGKSPKSPDIGVKSHSKKEWYWESKFRSWVIYILCTTTHLPRSVGSGWHLWRAPNCFSCKHLIVISVIMRVIIISVISVTSVIMCTGIIVIFIIVKMILDWWSCEAMIIIQLKIVLTWWSLSEQR